MRKFKTTPMSGRLKKGYSQSISTKNGFKSGNYECVNYPAINFGEFIGNFKIEIHKLGSMIDESRSRRKDTNDWNESEKELIYSYFPKARFDKYGNVYPISKASTGLPAEEAFQMYNLCCELVDSLEWQSEIYTMEDAERDGFAYGYPMQTETPWIEEGDLDNSKNNN
jgi:hypothetical protein